MTLITCIVLLLCFLWFLSMSAGYFYHVFNTFKESHWKLVSANEFIELFKQFDPVIISMEGLEIILTQTELLDTENDAVLYCSLNNNTYRIGQTYYILFPFDFFQIDSYLRTRYASLKETKCFYKNNKEQLEEIEKGPFYTTEEVKERLRTRFPFLKDLK